MMMPGLGMVDATTKPLRELFIGNIPEGTQPDMLHEFLAVAMREVGMIAADAPDPILTVRVNPKFAFAEFRSVGDAKRCAEQLGKTTVHGAKLKASAETARVRRTLLDDVRAAWGTHWKRGGANLGPASMLCACRKLAWSGRKKGMSSALVVDEANPDAARSASSASSRARAASSAECVACSAATSFCSAVYRAKSARPKVASNVYARPKCSFMPPTSSNASSIVRIAEPAGPVCCS